MKNGNRANRIRRKFGADAFRKWGRRGGSPILLAHKLKRPVRGYRVTHT